MPKQKPHKGVKKRVKISGRDKVMFKGTNAGHLMSGKESSRKRRFRRDKIMSKSLAKKSLEALK